MVNNIPAPSPLPPELESSKLAALQRTVRRAQQEDLMPLVRWAYSALAGMAVVLGLLALLAFMEWLAIDVAITVALLLFLLLSVGTVYWFMQARQVQAPKTLLQGTLVRGNEMHGEAAESAPQAGGALANSMQVDIAVTRAWRLHQFGTAAPVPTETLSPLRLQVNPKLYPALVEQAAEPLYVVMDGKTLLAYVAEEEVVYHHRRVALN